MTSRNPNTRIEGLNTKKTEHSNKIETQSITYRNTVRPKNTKQNLTKEKKMYVLTKKLMSAQKKKTTKTLLSFRNKDWKTVHAETESKY